MNIKNVHIAQITYLKLIYNSLQDLPTQKKSFDNIEIPTNLQLIFLH